uniref:Putative mitochondrial/plastidial beta-ketoacyl-acp reductase n=1 Tax=Ixodes ricinus TaxID=34613 RepID=A0A0K8RKC8_IXORI
MSLSIVVNSAGIVHNASGVENVPEAVFDKVIGVNLKGTYLVTKEAVTWMLQKNATGRAVLNIASVSGKGGYPFLSACSASKGAVISFNKICGIRSCARRNSRQQHPTWLHGHHP